MNAKFLLVVLVLAMSTATSVAQYGSYGGYSPYGSYNSYGGYGYPMNGYGGYGDYGTYGSQGKLTLDMSILLKVLVQVNSNDGFRYSREHPKRRAFECSVGRYTGQKEEVTDRPDF